MQNISWEIIAETPWWLYFLYLYLLWSASLSLKPQQILIKRLFYYPVLYLILILPLLLWQFGLHLPSLSLLGASFLLGLPTGFIYCQFKKVHILYVEKSIVVNRSWLPLVLMLILISIYCYFQPTLTAMQLFLSNQTSSNLFFGLFGLTLGLMLGQLAWIAYYFKQAERKAH